MQRQKATLILASPTQQMVVHFVSLFKSCPYFALWIGNKLAAFQKSNNTVSHGRVAQSTSQGSIQSHAASKSNTHPGQLHPERDD